ncbi:MAG: NUDIX domain-containing protein [Bacteroidales bacterium]|nr:NUDIX domain-containing protein [Bacteroidales bacterium]
MKVSYKYHIFNIPLRWLRCLKRRMRWVRAAGGIVTDDTGDMMLIRRNDRWDLPKGKVEAGETLLQAALREVEEETGVAPLPTAHYPQPTKTYHVFNLYGGWHLKQTSWFPMHAAGEHPHGTPQDEEGITEVVWVSPDVWYRRLQSSYGTLRTLSTLWQNRHSS